jgi:hypothetical protein
MRFTPVSAITSPPPIIEARFRGVVLHDPSEVTEWARRVSLELARFHERIDLLIDLEGLKVNPSASRAFGEARTRVLSTYARHSARFGPDAWTATSVNTSRVLLGAEANIQPSRDAALALLIELRAGRG